MSGLSWDVREGVLILRLDTPDSRVNTLTPELLGAFGEALARLEQDADIRAAVLCSAKPESFVVGADIRAFADFGSRQEVLEAIRAGHALLGRLERSSKPVVAAVDGACLGGGLELVLACRYVLATERSRFGLPEVKLGLLPGLGGTQRLPRRVGLSAALDMLLTGKNVYAKRARKLGLIDALHHAPGLLASAERAARGLADGTLKPQERRVTLKDQLLERTPLRRAVYAQAAERVNEETRGNYPAPARILGAVRTGLEQGMAAGLGAEAQAFADLLFTPESRALRHLFFAQRAAQKNPFAGAEDVRAVMVLGAGLMGAGIAQVSAEAGVDVWLKDEGLELAARAKGRMYREVSRRVGRGLTSFERDRLLGRVVPTAGYEGLSRADLTLEAAPERLDLKRKLLAEVEAATDAGHVFASNTSSIPIAEIAAAAERPEAVLGMHYFSPVPKMPLLEIVRAENTAEWALATAVALGLRQGKTPIVVRDVPGFYVNRVLAPYLNEALLALREGASVEAVDEAMEDAGFAVGPFRLLDEVGLDVAAHVTEVLRPSFAARGLDLVSVPEHALASGFTGRKGGRGFYRYQDEKRQGANPEAYARFGAPVRRTLPKRDIRERLLLAMVGEAVYALEEGVIGSPQEGDLGAVFGVGFPPFLGGPFHYLEHNDPAHILERLETLAEQHGPRFAPAELLRQRVAEGRAFGEG